MYDGRPNAELFLATGSVEDQNPSDCLAMRAELVKADRLYSSKKSIVESSGFSVSEVSSILPHFLFANDRWCWWSCFQMCASCLVCRPGLGKIASLLLPKIMTMLIYFA